MSTGFQDNYRRELCFDEPIFVLGLTLYPIKMQDYETWLDAKSALLLRLSTLPASYAVKCYLDALYSFDMNLYYTEGRSCGLLFRLATLLCLSLGLPRKYAEQLIQFSVSKSDPRVLKGICIKQEETQLTLSPQEFDVLREAIAIQNGEMLPDETENPELIEALELLNRGDGSLDINTEELISSVAYKSGIRKREIFGWTIREFEERRRAVERELMHSICALAESNGAKWKGGNPYPSWCYEKSKNHSGIFMPESAMLGQLGQNGTT